MNDLQINTTCGPPRSFRHASTCPRLDRPASGLTPVTPRTCIRRASQKTAARMLLSLWLPQKRVSRRHRSKLLGPFFKTYDMTSATALIHAPRDAFFRAEDPFTPYRTVTDRFQALFTSRSGVLFSVRSLY